MLFHRVICLAGLGLSAVASARSTIAPQSETSSSLTATANPTSLPIAATAASSVLASATLIPHLGNPANIQVYPVCAQICSNVTAIGFDCDTTDLNCACGSKFRSVNAACERVTCSDADYQRTQLLAQQLCDALYNNSTSLGSAVSSAIASATSFAVATVASKNVTDPASYPLCGQNCINKYLPLSGCGALSNRTCVCQNIYFDFDNIGSCERATCNASDVEAITDLSYLLCSPVGGVGNASGYFVTPGAGSTQTPASFTGNASAALMSLYGWGMMALAMTLGGLIML